MPGPHRIFALAFLMNAALSSPTLNAKNGDTTVYDINADPARQIAAFVDVAGRKHTAGIKRLAIISFTVEFIDSRATSVASAREDHNKRDDKKPTPVDVSVAIIPDVAQLGPVADTLYDLAVENLRGGGAEVLTPDAITALPAYAAFKTALAATPYRLEGSDDQGHRTSSVVSAHGLPAYTAGGRAAPSAMEIEFARRGNVTLLSAHLVVDFLTLHDADARLFRSKLVPKYVESVRAGETSFRLLVPDGSVATAKLKKSVRAPQSPVNPSRPGGPAGEDDSYSDSTDTNIERLAIDPAVYYDQALRYLGAAQDMLLGALVPSPAP